MRKFFCGIKNRGICVCLCLCAFGIISCLDEPKGGECAGGRSLGKDDTCQCTAPEDEYNRSSVNMDDASVTDYRNCKDKDHLSYAKDLELTYEDRYICRDYLCDKQKCPDGYVADKDQSGCVEKVKCDEMKEAYVEFKNECVCDESRHYAGEVGACECAVGYVDVEGDGVCVTTAKCDPRKEKLDVVSNTCVCDEDRHWVEIEGKCQCEPKNYVLHGEECARKPTCVANKEEYNPDTNKCDCSFNWTSGDDDTCICDESKGMVVVGDKCESKSGCTPKQVYRASDNACVCDGNRNFIKSKDEGKDCDCMDNHVYVEKSNPLYCGENNKCGYCEPRAACDLNREKYVESVNECQCDGSKYYKGTAGQCVCVDNYTEVGNQCEPVKSCDPNRQKYVKESNTCVCDDSKSFVLNNGNCVCGGNLVEVIREGIPVCETKTVCNEFKEKYVESTNSCQCDANKNAKGTPGNCTCVDGYTEVNSVCVQKKNCGDREKYSQTTNTCSCDDERGFAGNPGNCYCSGDNKVIVQRNGKPVCEDKTPCKYNEVWVEATNTCACNTTTNYTGSAGACRCKDGYLEMNKTCVKKTVCSGAYEKLNEQTNTCECQDSYRLLDKCTRDGDVVEFGEYQCGTTKVKLKWVVKKHDSEKALLLSRYVLDCGDAAQQYYNDGMCDAVWKTSTMRSWLNGLDDSNNKGGWCEGKDYTSNNFINSVFSSAERAKIKQVNINTPSVACVDGGISSDKIFLLSKSEVEEFFPEKQDRYGCSLANYGLTHNTEGCIYNSSERAVWLTRTSAAPDVSGSASSCTTAYSVNPSGDFENTRNNGYTGTRPALYLSVQ